MCLNAGVFGVWKRSSDTNQPTNLLGKQRKPNNTTNKKKTPKRFDSFLFWRVAFFLCQERGKAKLTFVGLGDKWQILLSPLHTSAPKPKEAVLVSERGPSSLFHSPAIFFAFICSLFLLSLARHGQAPCFHACCAWRCRLVCCYCCRC